MTKICNLFGGPSTGKSTIASGIFYQLKLSGRNVELAHEAAKTAAWEGRDLALKCQPYIFGKQLFKIERLVNQVECVISDSPLILSAIYANKYTNKYPQSFINSIVDIFNSFDNYNFFLSRLERPYNPKGRMQTEDKAKEIDEEIRNFLNANSIKYIDISGNTQSVDLICSHLYN